MLVFGRSLCLSPDAPPATPPAAAPPAVPPERKVDDFTTRMVAQHGTLENALRATAMRLFTAEDSVASLTGQVDQYKAKLPEGSLVLTKDAATTWGKLQDLQANPGSDCRGIEGAGHPQGQGADLRRQGSSRAREHRQSGLTPRPPRT